jgi:hypothetical protein
VNVRKDHPNVAAILEDSDCVIRVGGFKDLKACVLYGSGGTKPDQEFIFDNKDRWCVATDPHGKRFSSLT